MRLKLSENYYMTYKIKVDGRNGKFLWIDSAEFLCREKCRMVLLKMNYPDHLTLISAKSKIYTAWKEDDHRLISFKELRGESFHCKYREQ